MAPRKRKRRKLDEPDITGLKYFDQLAPLLERLHREGCQRDRAGNRQLHYDKYCLLVLLYLFNPIVTSLRGIQQASELKNVQRKLGCPRTSLGSLSEATRVFDAESLKEIIGELGEQLAPLAQDKRLAEIKHAITLPRRHARDGPSQDHGSLLAESQPGKRHGEMATAHAL